VGRVNNISRNNMREAISNVSEFVKESKDANIVLINAPHRHDLIPESCVNKEVWKFNRLLRKVAKLDTNVQLLEVDPDRSHFTRHGMHMNSKGKDFLSHQLAK
jgi:alkaline phosphatase